MRHTVLTLLPLLLAGACADESVSPVAQADAPLAQVQQGPIVHRVTAGGPDMCVALGFHPGCDGNYSLIALEREDGSVTGQWSDQDGSGQGIHAIVDCVKVVPIGFRPGLQAWIGGVVTRPVSAAGLRIITFVRDNGTSANDIPDVISRSVIDPENRPNEWYSANCQDMSPMGRAQVPQGQVTIE